MTKALASQADLASGIKPPRIWTARRDHDMWKDIGS